MWGWCRFHGPEMHWSLYTAVSQNNKVLVFFAVLHERVKCWLLAVHIVTLRYQMQWYGCSSLYHTRNAGNEHKYCNVTRYLEVQNKCINTRRVMCSKGASMSCYLLTLSRWPAGPHAAQWGSCSWTWYNVGKFGQIRKHRVKSVRGIRDQDCYKVPTGEIREMLHRMGYCMLQQ